MAANDPKTVWLDDAEKSGGTAEEAAEDPLGDPLGESTTPQGWSCNKCAFRDSSILEKFRIYTLFI